MDFFEYASFASYFVNTLWVQLLVGALCFLIVFIFEAIALYTIACNNGYSHKWMAFVPFFNTYYIGVCAQKNRFYNIDTKKIGIAAAVLEVLMVVMYIVYYVACYLVIEYEDVNIIGYIFNQPQYEYFLVGVPANLAWAEWMYNYMAKYILNIVELLFLLLQICLLICFFQTYACRRYVLFAITSILFPIQGILFFVVRNNKAINYKDFIRAQQARQYQMYQQYQQQNFNQNPYNNNGYNQNPYNQNPYNNPPQGGSQTPPDDPFGDLGGKGNSGNGGGSPFDDFDN